jgi:hypothetical protein
LRFLRTALETRLYTGIRDELDRPEWEAQSQVDVVRILTARAGTNDGERKRHAERLATVRREKANVLVAIRAGIFTPTVKAELEALEDEEARLESAPQIAEVVLVVPRAADRFRAAVRNLPQTLAKSSTRADSEL